MSDSLISPNIDFTVASSHTYDPLPSTDYVLFYSVVMCWRWFFSFFSYTQRYIERKRSEEKTNILKLKWTRLDRCRIQSKLLGVVVYAFNINLALHISSPSFAFLYFFVLECDVGRLWSGDMNGCGMHLGQFLSEKMSTLLKRDKYNNNGNF